MVPLSHPYMTTGKTIALTRRTFVSKVMSPFFNVLSRLLTAFLPRSRCLLISWLRLPSAGIVKVKPLGRVQLFMTPWTLTQQAPPSLGFSRQEYWSGLPFTSPGDLPNPGTEPRSPALQVDSLLSGPRGKSKNYFSSR